jgi:hypothetical protein
MGPALRPYPPERVDGGFSEVELPLYGSKKFAATNNLSAKRGGPFGKVSYSGAATGGWSAQRRKS